MRATDAGIAAHGGHGMLASMGRQRRADLAATGQRRPLPWLIIAGAFALTAAIILFKESGASDADTDYLSMVILIGAFALASALDRRTGLVVAVLAGVIAAIVPGSTSFTNTHMWDSLFRLCFLLAMSMSFYRVIVALRDREEHLKRQLGNVRRLQEEITVLHSIAARPPIDRAAIYRQIARAASRLAPGSKRALILRAQPGERWQIIARWPPDEGDDLPAVPPAQIDAADNRSYAITPRDGGQTITVPLSIGARVAGALQLECAAPEETLQEYGDLLAIYGRDATLALDHVALQERLEHLAVMGERGRIARELHDGLVQSLAGIAFHLEYHRDRLRPEDAAMRAGLDGMASDVKQALHEARSMIHELRNAPSPEHLAAALDELTQRIAAKSGLTVATDLPDLRVPISHAQATALVRIAQEALQNVVKHAHADAVSVRLAVDGERITFQVADNGRGFAPPGEGAAGSPAHFGLVGMAERAAMNGADLSVDSQVGRGTTVTLTFPVETRGTEA